MKQIWPTYAYSPTTNVLTLTGLNIDRDQLLLVTAADRGRIMYNFADSSVTASAFTSGANTALTLVATTAGLTTTAALVIYFDDQATSSTVTGTVELGPTSLNALESITVTMGQVTVTGGLTDVQLRASAVTVGGTVTVGNFPASQAVTFSAVTGSVSVLNFPASQAVTFTDASLTNTQLRASAVTVGGTVTVGNSITISSLPAISGTVTANAGNYFYVAVQNGIQSHQENNGFIVLELTNPLPAGTNRIGVVTIGAGTVTIGAGTAQIGSVTVGNTVTIAGTVTANPTGTQTIAGSVTLGAGTSQIGSVTASISGTVPISISSVTVGNSVTIGSLPAISGTVGVDGYIPGLLDGDGSIFGIDRTFPISGTVEVTGAAFINTDDDSITSNKSIKVGWVDTGNDTFRTTSEIYPFPVSLLNSVTASISNSAVTCYPAQGTSVSNTTFNSTTSSTTLVSAVAGRVVLTVFNEGAGNLFISPGATATTISYQVRLSAGDYWECPQGQLSLAYAAVFATAGTARVTQVS